MINVQITALTCGYIFFAHDYHFWTQASDNTNYFIYILNYIYIIIYTHTHTHIHILYIISCSTVNDTKH